MIGLVLGVGILVAMLAASTKARAADIDHDAIVADHVDKIVATGDAKKIAAAASAAHAAGEPELASGLEGEAKNAAITGPDATFASPFPDVTGPAWTKFVRDMRGKDLRAITPGYSLGLFGFGMRRLVDLGLAKNPKKGDYQGAKVWLADWLPKYQPGPDTFLEDAELQYQTFVKSCSSWAKQIRAKLPDAIGGDVDGTPATMSGLIAVCHRAGFDGLSKWFASPDVRAKFKPTTDLFNRENGVF